MGGQSPLGYVLSDLCGRNDRGRRSDFTRDGGHQTDLRKNRTEPEVHDQVIQPTFHPIQIGIVEQLRDHGAVHSGLLGIQLPRMEIHDQRLSLSFQALQKEAGQPIGQQSEVAASCHGHPDTQQVDGGGGTSQIGPESVWRR